MPPFRHIIFDLDGTLTDSSEGIINSVLYALNKIGITEQDPQKLLGFIGPPLYVSLQLHYGMSREEALKTVPIYREYFAAKGIYQNRLYPGAKALLERLHTQGKKIYLATSKPIVYTHRILGHFGIEDYFSGISGASLDGSLDHKPEIIGMLLRQNPQIEIEKAVMIGDRKYDIEGAHAHRLKAIGVTWGYGSPEELRQARAEALADSFDTLSALLDEARDPGDH
jgi:phosphoglycolate phosphatase